MASSLIRDYEDEFTSTAESAKRDMAALRAGLSRPAAGGAESPSTGDVANAVPPAQRSEVNRNIHASVARMRDVLSNLEIEAAQAPAAVRAEVKSRTAVYKTTLAGLERDSAQLKRQCADAEREELLRGATSTAQRNLEALGTNGSGEGESAETLRMKAQMARNTTRMKDSSKTLQEAERLTFEMNDMADDTLVEMEKQRSTMRNISGNIRATDEELSHVQRILRNMHREMLKNKLMLAAIIAILVIMILGILYYKYGGTSATHSDEAGQVSGGGQPVGTVPPAPPPSSGAPDTWIPSLPPS